MAKSITQKRDQTPIFGAVAKPYYDRDMPLIPLHYHDKRPLINDWSRFHDQPVPEELREQWLEQYSNCNVGLVLGRQSGVTVMDIDTEDEHLIKLIQETIPQSPWVRVGKKGMQLAFKYTGIPTFRIKDVAGNTIVEYLSSRTQTVLPPSIHPETQRPYQANCELVDVIDQLPILNNEVESVLRGAFKEAGIELSYSGWTRVTDFTPAGARDVQMTKVAGHYAYGVMRGELPLAEAVERMKAWYATCTEKVAGDDVDIDKGITNLVKFVVRDVMDKNKILPKGWDEGLTDEQKESMGLTFDDESEEWDHDELKEYLHEQFERHEPGTPGRFTAVEKVMSQVARSTSLNTLDEDRIMKYIVDASGLGLTMTSLRKRVRELQQGDVKGTDHTEIARAVIRDLEQITFIRFHGGRYWRWGGAQWEILPESEIQKQIAENYGHLSAAKRNSDHNGILRTISTLIPQGIKTVEVKGVNFANGVLMKNGELRPHDPDYGMTYTLPFRYIPEAAGKAFKFHEFLEGCWGQDEDFVQKVQALQEAMCSTMFGMGPSYQRAILLYGAPKTGKSQLLKIVSSLVPEDGRSTCPPESWNDKFAPTTMFQSVINVCGELSDNRPIDGQRFKSIIDGEEMDGQYKGGQLFKFRPTCTHWFASNHLPKTNDASAGFNRRWLTLGFWTPVKKEDRVLDLGEIIVAEEREAISAWAIEALPRLLKQSEYTLPPSHEQTMEEVANMNNSVRFFIAESGLVEVDPVSESDSSRTSEMKLHNAYWSFCLGAGAAKPVGPRAFRQRMKELGSEMGFKMRILPTANGGQEPVYDGLILVSEKGKSNSSSMSSALS